MLFWNDLNWKMQNRIEEPGFELRLGEEKKRIQKEETY